MKKCFVQTKPPSPALSVETKVRLRLLHFPTERPVTRCTAQSCPFRSPSRLLLRGPAVLPSWPANEISSVQTLHLYVIGYKTAKIKPSIKTIVRRQIVIQTVTDANQCH